MTKPLFNNTGAHVLVDGQFGSTGKGALAAWLAHQAVDSGAIGTFDGVITNAGPNSGHTSYFGDEKIVPKQLPTFAVHAMLLGRVIPVYLSAGAVIDLDIFLAEAKKYPNIPIFVHPNAAVITSVDKQAEREGSIAEVAGTRSGTGAALARKIYRQENAIWNYWKNNISLSNVATMGHYIHPERNSYFVEASQGFSLGINSEFYPKVTSRECTVMQAIADARIPPRQVAMTYMCLRTYPIRVGNVDGHSSGDWYHDQFEVRWSDIGVPAERTTVTNRIRRVATFSITQFSDAVKANDPDWIAINFLNYLNSYEARSILITDIVEHMPIAAGIIGGYGPKVEDWEIIQ